MEKTIITVENTVKASIEKVWEFWGEPKHVVKWNTASPDWHSPRAENDLRKGGSFSYRMEAKDGSFGFDFGGIYDEVDTNKYIEYTMADGRNVKNRFVQTPDGVHITVSFEAEKENPVEMQQFGWQAILDSFKKYAEANA